MISNLITRKDTPDSANESLALVCQMIREIDEVRYRDAAIELGTKLEDLGFDSIAFMQMVLTFGNYFDRDIDEVLASIDLKKLVAISDIVEVVDRLKK